MAVALGGIPVVRRHKVLKNLREDKSSLYFPMLKVLVLAYICTGSCSGIIVVS